MSRSSVPPFIASEIGSRLRAIDPSVGTVLDYDEIEIESKQLEGLLTGAYLAGYADAFEEVIADDETQLASLPFLARWIQDNVLD